MQRHLKEQAIALLALNAFVFVRAFDILRDFHDNGRLFEAQMTGVALFAVGIAMGCAYFALNFATGAKEDDGWFWPLMRVASATPVGIVSYHAFQLMFTAPTT